MATRAVRGALYWYAVKAVAKNRNSVLSYVRRSRVDQNTGQCEELLIICNFTPLVRENYRVGVPHTGFWREVLNSDSELYGGSSVGNLGGTQSGPVPFHGRPHSLNLTLPPLGMLVLKHQPGEVA